MTAAARGAAWSLMSGVFSGSISRRPANLRSPHRAPVALWHRNRPKSTSPVSPQAGTALSAAGTHWSATSCTPDPIAWSVPCSAARGCGVVASPPSVPHVHMSPAASVRAASPPHMLRSPHVRSIERGDCTLPSCRCGPPVRHLLCSPHPTARVEPPPRRFAAPPSRPAPVLSARTRRPSSRRVAAPPGTPPPPDLRTDFRSAAPAPEASPCPANLTPPLNVASASSPTRRPTPRVPISEFAPAISRGVQLYTYAS